MVMTSIALVTPTLYTMDTIINVCEIFADKIGLLFNPLKSQLLCYNVDNPDTVCLTTIRTSLYEKHLGYAMIAILLLTTFS